MEEEDEKENEDDDEDEDADDVQRLATPMRRPLSDIVQNKTRFCYSICGRSIY